MPESIENITQADLQPYYDRHYVPANISVIAVGGMRLPQIVNLLLKSPFGLSKPGNRTPLLEQQKRVPPLKDNRLKIKMSEFMSAGNLPKVCVYRAVSKMPGVCSPNTLGILRDIMMHGILFAEVREKRALAYSIDASIISYGDFHEFCINCDGLSLAAADKIDAIIDRCLDIANSSKKFFQQMKRRAIAENSMNDMSGRQICDAVKNDLVLKQRIDSSAKEIEMIERVTFDEIQEALQWLKSDYRFTLLTRP